MAIELLPLLKNAGIDSLKIEGRMKSPEYVAIVTSIYRKYLDILENEGEENFRVEETDKEILMQAFNRGGFTRGFLEGNRNFRRLVYTKHPKNQGILLGQVAETRPLYVKVKLDKDLNMGDGIEIYNPSGEVVSFVVTSILEKNQQVRFAQAGSEVWIGDVKAAVKKGIQVYRTLSRLLFDEARKTFEHKEIPGIPLDMEFIMKAGERAILTVTDPDGSSVDIMSEVPVEKAVNKALSNVRIREQLEKTGGTPYYVRKCSISSDNESVMPISAINAMRRKALEDIKDIRVKKYKKPFSKAYEDFYEEWASEKGQKKKPEKLFLSAYFYAIPDSIGELDDYLGRVYLPVVAPEQLKKFKEEFDGEIYIWTPAILKDDELDSVKEKLETLTPVIDGIAYGNLGVNKICKEAFTDVSLCAEPSINIFNDSSVKILEELNTATAVLSPELHLKEIKEIKVSNLKLEAIVYGRIPLMTMEHCPSSLEIPCTGKCGDCSGKEGFLKDRKNEIFPFVRDTVLKRTQIFNSCVIFMDDIDAVKDTEVSIFRLIFTDEDKLARKAVAKYFFEKISGNNNHEPWVIESINKIRENGYTKGHWYRGTE